MSLTLQKVEELAPDQASLSAAKKLLGANKWQGQGFSQATTTAWGECQGSGSKPYYVVVDVEDYGYKCSCPSRKFPCKHTLALMWRYVNDPSPFTESPAPDWVNDWLGRRRKSTKTNSQTDDNKPTTKSIDKALEDTTPAQEADDPKKQAVAIKRAQKTKLTTDASISAGLNELEGWLNDQLRMGMGVFMDKIRERTRQIASRLVDAKATAMASRLDELSSVMHNQPKQTQASAVFAEFGRIHLLIQAWRQMPDDPDVRRFVHATESKDKIAQHSDAHRLSGIWQVVGEKVQTRKDGLISQATYLVRLTDDNPADTPNTAMLLDFHHPTSGFKRTTSTVGAVMAGRLIYYPSRVPFRAFFETVETKFATSIRYYGQDINSTDNVLPKPVLSTDDLYTAYAHHLTKIAWANHFLHTLGAGKIGKDSQGGFWYVAQSGQTIRLANQSIEPMLLASDIEYGFILWDGLAGELLSVQTTWGLISC